MKVIINGLPLFATRLANDLSEVDPSSSFQFLDTYNSLWDKIMFKIKVPFCDLVISMNGVSDESGSMNHVLNKKKKLVLQWMGTDISMAIERNQNGTLLRKYIDYAENFVDSEWMKEEVDSLALESKEVKFKHIEPQKVLDKYEAISVVSYVAEGRSDFYGLPKLEMLAKSNPNIPFHVYGMKPPTETKMPNIHFLGWVAEEEFKSALLSASIFLRLTEHDGNSISVTEALAAGAEVLWTFPNEYVHHVKNDADLLATFQIAINKVKSRNLKPNKDQSEKVIYSHQKKVVIGNYLKELKRIIES